MGPSCGLTFTPAEATRLPDAYPSLPLKKHAIGWRRHVDDVMDVSDKDQDEGPC